MEYILDAYNLIKSSFLREHERRRSMDHARDALLNLLIDYKRKHPSVGFTAVFDGFPPSPGIYLKDRKIKILFSGDITADETIRLLLEKDPDSNRFKTVVSDDRGVLDCGRLLGSGILKIAGFMALVYPPEKKVKGTKKWERSPDLDINRLKIEKELKDFYNKSRHT